MSASDASNAGSAAKVDPVERVKALEANGKISPEEAGRLIDAISQLASASAARPRGAKHSAAKTTSDDSSDDPSNDQGTNYSREHHRREHRHRGQRRNNESKSRNQSGFQWRWDLGDLNLNEQLGNFISDTVSSLMGEMLGGDARSKFRGIDGRWVNDTNRAQLSHLETPTGENFTVENNNISAAHIAKLRLDNSKFVGNSLQGGRLFELTLSNSKISDNQFHGAAVTESKFVHSKLENLKLNGASFDKLELQDAEIDGGEWNGANMKNVVLIGSRMIHTQVNGGRFKDVRLEADTVVERLRLVGSSWRRCKLINTTFQDVRMSRQDISDFICESTVLTDVKFKSDWQKPVKNLRMHNFQAKNVRFRDCQFDDTEFLDCAIDGLRFEGVDFSAMTLSSASEFQNLAIQKNSGRSTNHE